jgi:uncharacterized membrane protein
MTAGTPATAWNRPTAPPAPSPARPVEVLPDPSDQPRPTAALFLLFLSLVGFVIVALVLYEFKFHGTTEHIHGLPTRVIFVVGLAFAVAPYLLTAFRRVPAVFLVLPTVLVFFLYPIFSPHGLPFSRDPIFNFQFANAVASSSTWVPLAGVTAQAGTYSYYPGGAVYSAALSSLTTLPLIQTYDWGYFVLRILIVPLAIYAVAARLFSARSAPLAVLVYLGIPSIEFNIPTQQDFAVTWFILALTVLAFLATSRRSSTFLQACLIAFGVIVIITHHVSTYLLLGWLGGLTVLPWILRRRDPYPNARTFVAFLQTLVTVLVWAVVVTLPVLKQQSGLLAKNLALLIHPVVSKSPGGAARGSTFPLYQDGWIALAIAFIVLLGLFTLLESYRKKERNFLTFSVLTGIFVVLLSIPFLFTTFNFLLLRVFEYAGVVLAPAAAFWLVHRIGEGQTFPRRSRARPRPPPTRAVVQRRRAVGAAIAVVLAVLIFTGGSLVPLSTRDQFAGKKGVLIDSALFIDRNAFEAVQWASNNLNHSKVMWGDELVLSTFGAFGGFRIHYNSYLLFNGTGFNQSQVNTTAVGMYVVTDIYLTTIFLPPEFPGSPANQPSTALTDQEVAKFTSNPAYFGVVYQNSIFTIVELQHPLPPGGL